MIFLTIGTQLPFDRLVEAMDKTAEQIEEPVFGQIGRSSYTPKNFLYADHLAPSEFESYFAEARLIVAHAGIGTILTASRLQKSLALMARSGELSEHRNDHQFSTLKQMRELQGIYEIENADSLWRVASHSALKTMSSCPSPARLALISSIKSLISAGPTPTLR